MNVTYMVESSNSSNSHHYSHHELGFSQLWQQLQDKYFRNTNHLHFSVSLPTYLILLKKLVPLQYN